jgi:hypothetical protein
MNENEFKLDLGWFELCLDVHNVQISVDFYSKLGFEVIHNDFKDNWALLKYRNLRLALYQGHLSENILNFRGGDVNLIANTLKDRGLELTSDAITEADGSIGATILDPDENLIYFNTSDSEIAPED